MTEPTHSDVWLCRLEGDEASRLRTAGTMFRVDVRGARQILAQLPRLVARDLPNAEARKVAARLRAVGGVAHVCASGEKPDFDAIAAGAQEPESAARQLAPRAPAAAAKPASGLSPPASASATARADELAARAEPTRAESRQKPQRAAPARSDAEVTAARSAQDAAMANWPDDTTPCAWETTESTPPVLPAPIRHSAARVVWTLAIVLSVVGGASGAFWMRFGRDVLAVSIAEPHSAPKHHPKPTAATTAPAASRFAIAQELAAAAAASEPFRALSTRVAKALGASGEPLSIENQVVGLSFELRTDAAQAALEAQHEDVRAAGAALFRTQKASRDGFDRVALVPSADVPTLVRLIGTSGGAAPGEQGALDTSQVVAWLQALHSARAVRVLGIGERFVEGRYEVPAADASELSSAVFTCPGAPPAPPDRARFTCAW